MTKSKGAALELRKAVEDTLMYTRSAKAIKAEMARVSDSSVTTMKQCIRDGEWNHPIFFQKESYSTLLKSYQQDVIDEDTFISVQSLLHLYTQFGYRTDLPLHHRLQGEVKRIDLSQQDSEWESLASGLLKAFKNETDLINGKTRQAVKRILDYLIYKGQTVEDSPLWVDVIELNESDGKQLEESSESITDDWEPHTQKKQILSWLKVIDSSVAPVNIFLHGRKVYLFPRPILNELKEELSVSNIKFDPVYGIQTAEDVMKKRLDNKHVEAIFHPLVGDRFRAPHGQQIGCLTSLHDEYHEALLSRIPEWARRVYCHCNRYEQELKGLLAKLDYSHQKVVLSSFPEEFVKVFLENPIFSMRSARHLSDNREFTSSGRKESFMEVFHEELPFLDQEFTNYPIQSDGGSDEAFCSSMVSALFASSRQKSAVGMLSVIALAPAFNVKLNWILYRMAQDRPEDYQCIVKIFEKECQGKKDFLSHQLYFAEDEMKLIVFKLLQYHNSRL